MHIVCEFIYIYIYCIYIFIYTDVKTADKNCCCYHCMAEDLETFFLHEQFLSNNEEKSSFVKQFIKLKKILHLFLSDNM